MLKDIFTCFKYKGEYQYDIKMPLASYKKTANPLDVVKELYKCHNSLVYIGNTLPLPEPEPIVTYPDTTIYDFL